MRNRIPCLMDLCDSPFCINEPGVHETRSYPSSRPTITQSAAPFIQLACLARSPWSPLHVASMCHGFVYQLARQSMTVTSYHCVSTKDVSLHGTKSLGIGLNCEPEKLLYVFTSFYIYHIYLSATLHLSMCLSGSSPTISLHLNTVYQYYVHLSVLFQGLM